MAIETSQLGALHSKRPYYLEKKKKWGLDPTSGKLFRQLRPRALPDVS